MNRSVLAMLAALVVLLGGCAQAILPSGPGAAGGPRLTALTVTPPSASIPGVTQQQFKQSKLPGLEFYLLSGPHHFPREQVHL